MSGDPAQLLTEINTALSPRPISPSTVLSQVAWVRSGAPGAIGQTVVYPVPFIGNKWEVQSLYEEVGGTLPEQVRFSHTIQMWGPKPVLIPMLTKVTDIYGILTDSAQRISKARVKKRLVTVRIGPQNTRFAVVSGHGESAPLSLVAGPFTWMEYYVATSPELAAHNGEPYYNTDLF